MSTLKADIPPAFKISAHPIEKRYWLTQNQQSQDQCIEKQKLFDERLDDVWCDNGECGDAQIEALETICAALNLTANPSSDEAPLLQAAKLVQDDLVLMQKTDQGWVLAAGAVCFPSSWSLQEKFNRPLHIVHQHVPGFGPQSRNAKLIARMFDNLAVGEPIMRGNWGVLPDAELFHPTPHHMPDAFEDYGKLTFRHERQTLLKLERSGVILFTIRISLWPLADIRSNEILRTSFEKEIETMTLDEIRYKAMAKHKESLLEWLNQS